MKPIPLAFTLLFLFSLRGNAQQFPELSPIHPLADPAAVVISPPARFTVLTPVLIRMELSSSSSSFEDRASLAVLNRKLPVPSFTVSNSSTTLTITTDKIQLTYKKGGGIQNGDVVVKSLDSSSAFKQWSGQSNDQTRNLYGTVRSLDLENTLPLNCTQADPIIVNGESLHCEWGLISRDGWAIVNETGRWCLGSDGWWDSPNTNALDLYLFAYGHEYKQALSDFTQISGKIAMVPQHLTGIWWTRWTNLNSADVKKIVNDYRSHSLPLDVFVLDMDWHYKEAPWGGYTWDERLFPFPGDVMGELKSMGLKIFANIHDDDGVHHTEKMYNEMAAAVGIDPNTKQTIPFSIVNKTYLPNLDDIVLGDDEKLGIDYWWIDWQQGEYGGGAAGFSQNPTIWLNKMRGTDNFRNHNDEREAVLARWGGLGNHRYQVGFSGDVASLSWQALAYQPYFSFTASNVGYGFWSHDLEGPRDDQELYVRWVQWVAFSAVFRSHDRGMAIGSCADQDPITCSIIKPWDTDPYHFEIIRNAMNERARLVPYLYQGWREAYDTGVSLLRPMYYEFPENDMAYAGGPDGSYAQYFLGNDMIVAPIVTPVDKKTRLAKKEVWLPKGTWIEKTSGRKYIIDETDGQIITNSYDLSEIPVFVKGGSVIFERPVVPGDTIGLAGKPLTDLIITIYPGKVSGTAYFYEDDGHSTAYMSTTNPINDPISSAVTTVTYSSSSSFNPPTISVTLSTKGDYEGLPSTRNVFIRFVNTGVITDVIGDGEYKQEYFGEEVVAEVLVKGVAVKGGKQTSVVVEFDSLVTFSKLDGIKCKIAHATLAKRTLDQDATTPGSQTTVGQFLSLAAGLGQFVSYSARHVPSTAPYDGLDDLLEGAKREVYALQPYAENMLLGMYNEWRKDNCLCGSQTCANTNSDYYQVRIEGWQPLSSDQGAVPLYIFYSNDKTDNFVTTNTSSVPSGYVMGAGNGYVLNYQAEGTVPVKVYYNELKGDHLTTATSDGEAVATAGGYKLIDGAIGYVYVAKMEDREKERVVGDASRLDYVNALLRSC